MSNIVAFRRQGALAPGQNLARLVQGVTQQRRADDDVFWLKEVAELLGVMAAAQPGLSPDALAPLARFYAALEDRLRFYPQYYRFLLSISLDLEDLGLPGSTGETIAHWVAAQNLPEAELSDLQRAEARRLLARRGAHAGPHHGALAQRLHRFMDQSAQFALPNKKAGYELTHIVFYLSDYGRHDPGLSADALQSLIYVGVLAVLDQDMDLLAEVCIAQRFAGQQPPEQWEAAVSQAHDAVRFGMDAAAPLNDGYHGYLVTGWAQAAAGRGGFEAPVPDGPLRITFDRQAPSVLRAMSECLFDLGPARSADWEAMRGRVMASLMPQEHEVLYHAEQSVGCFAQFFEYFARAGRITGKTTTRDPRRLHASEPEGRVRLH